MPQQRPLTVGQAVRAQPGDSFLFHPPSASVQYHVEVQPADPDMVIAAWKGHRAQGTGQSKNKPGANYIDHAFKSTGPFEITVEGADGPFTIKVTANSWLKKVFGWDIFGG